MITFSIELDVYDDFHEMLTCPKEYGMTLAELESDINNLYKKRRRKHDKR